MEKEGQTLPFSLRYSFPAHIAENIDHLSWDTVIQLSSDFTISSKEKSEKIRKIIKELHMTRLILLEKIRANLAGGKIDPKILVDVVHLLEKCERLADEYDIDLQNFTSFLYVIVEKLKKEKLAYHKGTLFSEIKNSKGPMKEEFLKFKEAKENTSKEKPLKKPKKKK
jgi:hypothetical protein